MTLATDQESANAAKVKDMFRWYLVVAVDLKSDKKNTKHTERSGRDGSSDLAADWVTVT